MMRIPKKLLFALEAVVDIAYNGGSEPVRSRDITRRQGIPHRYLEQVMQRMVRAGLLKGVRGPRGGYLLARERRRITIGEIARVVHSLEYSDDSLGEEGRSDLTQRVLNPIWTEMQEEMMYRLDQVTIEDICQKAGDTGVASEARAHIDYTI